MHSKEEIRKIREFWCHVFGMPLSVLDDIDNCITLGESTDGLELIPGQKPIVIPHIKKKNKKKK